MITNASSLGTTPARRDALAILQAGLDAIDTAGIIASSVHLDGSALTIGTHRLDLASFRHVHVIGFGKASCDASVALAGILGDRITSGVALANKPGVCENIEICEATHPMPSATNLAHTERMLAACENLTADDLVIVVVSGGGSAMLCWPASECDQATQLYEAANRTGMGIEELNTVRKHLSGLKGGGLATRLAPATVVGLVFSDVPSDHPELVASGPTYLDTSTTANAQAIIDRYGLGTFTLIETPKDPAGFTHVTNIVLVSGATALTAMASRATALGYTPTIVGGGVIAPPDDIIARMQADATAPKSVALVGGEAQFTVPAEHGIGGRNQHMAVVSLATLKDNQVFAALASDGIDNTEVAGAIVDTTTRDTIAAQHADIAGVLTRHDEFPLLKSVGAHIITGPTGANVSDLYLLLAE